MEKISYGALNRLNDCLQRLMSLTGDYGLCIAKTKMAIAGEVGVYKEMFDNVVKKYGEENDGKISISHKSPRWKEFLTEYEKLITTETEVNIYRVKADGFKLDDIKCDGANAEDYMVFSELMVEKE